MVDIQTFKVEAIESGVQKLCIMIDLNFVSSVTATVDRTNRKWLLYEGCVWF